MVPACVKRVVVQRGGEARTEDVVLEPRGRKTVSHEAREHFDASAWGAVTPKRRAHWAEEATEMVKEKEMPLNSYTWTHADARLTDGQREQLTTFFNGLR